MTEKEICKLIATYAHDCISKLEALENQDPQVVELESQHLILSVLLAHILGEEKAREMLKAEGVE